MPRCLIALKSSNTPIQIIIQYSAVTGKQIFINE